MREVIVAMILLVALVFGPVGWLVWRDRRESRALAVRAEILWALRRAFRGESLLSVQVIPATLWRPGRVLLWVPSGWEWMIEVACKTLITTVPSDYELVVRLGQRRLPGAGLSLPARRHAA